MFLSLEIKKLEIAVFIKKFSTLTYGTILIVREAEVDRLQSEYDSLMASIYEVTV